MGIRARAYVISGDIEPDSLKKELRKKYPKALLQTLGAKAARNEFFVEMIAAQTLQAGATKSLLARKPEIDFLLRVAGTTQITEAIGKVGSKKGEKYLLVIASLKAPVAGLRRSEAKKLPRTDLSEAELMRIEEAALLSALRG